MKDAARMRRGLPMLAVEWTLEMMMQPCPRESEMSHNR
jgi:hypothetical protein